MYREGKDLEENMEDWMFDMEDQSDGLFDVFSKGKFKQDLTYRAGQAAAFMIQTFDKLGKEEFCKQLGERYFNRENDEFHDPIYSDVCSEE